MKKHFVFLALLLVMAACGSQSHSEKPANGGDQVPKKDNINEPWSVISKSCNGMSLKSESSEKYRLDENLFVRVEGDDTAARRCVVAYVYERLVSEASHSITTRQERGVLQGSKGKRKCYDKNDLSGTAKRRSDHLWSRGAQLLARRRCGPRHNGHSKRPRLCDRSFEFGIGQSSYEKFEYSVRISPAARKNLLGFARWIFVYSELQEASPRRGRAAKGAQATRAEGKQSPVQAMLIWSCE
jgi:hypothetical protein